MARPIRRGTPQPTQPATSRPRSLFMTDSNLKRRAAPARLGAPIALLALAAGLAGCAVGPNYVKPDSQVAPQFEGARDGAFSTPDCHGRFCTPLGEDSLHPPVDYELQATHDLT